MFATDSTARYRVVWTPEMYAQLVAEMHRVLSNEPPLAPVVDIRTGERIA